MKFRRGVNLGGWFSHLALSPSQFPDHVGSYITKEDLKHIQEVGFDHVRLTLDAYFLTEPIAERLLEEAVKKILDQGLLLQLNMHYGPGMVFSPGAFELPLFFNSRLQSEHQDIWRRWLDRFGSMGGIAFEFMNEPTCSSSEILNHFQAKLVKGLRNHTDAPFILTSNAYSSPKLFSKLTPPSDGNLLYAFHFYSPLLFTHQKAPWVTWTDVTSLYAYPGVLDKEPALLCGSSEAGSWDRERMEAVLQPVLDFRLRTGIEVLCNEWGVYEAAPRASLLKWIGDVRPLFERFGIGWTYWNYRGCGFGIVGDRECIEVLLERASTSI